MDDRRYVCTDELLKGIEPSTRLREISNALIILDKPTKICSLEMRPEQPR